MQELPAYSALPIDKSGPPLNAWGLYGPDDELGRINLITPDSIKRGRDSINEGLAVNLNLPLGIFPPNPKRKGLVHTIKCSGHSNDDEIEVNTQSSTQWDGFRHYPYQDYPKPGQYRFYMGMTLQEASDPTVTKLGVHNYATKPITSRAHLLDIPSYLSSQSLPPLDPFSKDSIITLPLLLSCAKACGVKVVPGDILLINTGYVEALDNLSHDEKVSLRTREVNGCIGVDRGEDIWKWHWESGISAVASDCLAYEAWPAPPGDLTCHQLFIAGWGLPIGELFDLRELAAKCKELKRWTFLFTSMPLNVVGGIASPPNAQAIL